MFHLEYKPEPVGYAGTLDVLYMRLGTLQYALCNKYVCDDKLKKRSQQPLYKGIWLVTSGCAVPFLFLPSLSNCASISLAFPLKNWRLAHVLTCMYEILAACPKPLPMYARITQSYVPWQDLALLPCQGVCKILHLSCQDFSVILPTRTAACQNLGKICWYNC